MLLALTLTQPWAWAMTVPPPPHRKEVENRTWKPAAGMVGQRFAIHTSKSSWDVKGASLLHEMGFRFPNETHIARGVIVATAVLDRVVTSKESLPAEQHRWFFGTYGLVLRDVFLLPRPVACKGMLGFWRVPEGQEVMVMDQVVNAASRSSVVTS